MGSTLIKVQLAEVRDAFIPKKERLSWVYAFFSPGKASAQQNLMQTFWDEYLMPEFMDGFKVNETEEESITKAIARFEQKELSKSRRLFADYCAGFTIICRAGSDRGISALIRVFQYGLSGCVIGSLGENNLFSPMSDNFPAVVVSNLPVQGADAYIRLDTYNNLRNVRTYEELMDQDTIVTEQPMMEPGTLNDADADDYMKNLVEDGYFVEAVELKDVLRSRRYDDNLLVYLYELNELRIDVGTDGPQKYKAVWDQLKADYPLYISGGVPQEVFKKATILHKELQKLMAAAAVGGARVARHQGNASAYAPIAPANQLPKIDQDYANAVQTMQVGNYGAAMAQFAAIKVDMNTQNPTTFTLQELNTRLKQAEEMLHIDEVNAELNAGNAKKANKLYASYSLNDLVLKAAIDQSLKQTPGGIKGFFDQYKYHLIGAGGLVVVLVLVLTVLVPLLRDNAVALTAQSAGSEGVVTQLPATQTPAAQTPVATSPGDASVATERGTTVVQTTPRTQPTEVGTQTERVDTSLSLEDAIQKVAAGDSQYIDHIVNNMCTKNAKVYVHGANDSYQDLGSMRNFLLQVSVKKQMGYTIEQVVNEGNKVEQLILK